MHLISITDETRQRLFVQGSTTTSPPLGTLYHTGYVTEANSIIHSQDSTRLLFTDISKTF